MHWIISNDIQHCSGLSLCHTTLCHGLNAMQILVVSKVQLCPKQSLHYSNPEYAKMSLKFLNIFNLSLTVTKRVLCYFSISPLSPGTSCCWQRYTVCMVRGLIINATCLPPRNSYIFIIIGTLWHIVSPLCLPLPYICPGSGWLLINSVDVLLA